MLQNNQINHIFQQIKKRSLIFMIFGIIGISLGTCKADTDELDLPWASNDYGFYYNTNTVIQKMGETSEWTEDLGAMIRVGMTEENQGNIDDTESFVVMIIRMLGFYDIDEYNGIPKAIIYAKSIINLLLSLLSMIALVILIYAFYVMFFTEDGEWFGKVKNTLKGLVIGFVFLGLSRILVSFIFNFYEKKILPEDEQPIEIGQEDLYNL